MAGEEEQPPNGLLREPILWLGLAAMLGFTLAAEPGLRLMPDEPDYIRLGRALAAGEGFTWGEYPAVKRAPGYPAFLALVFGAFGPDAFTAACFIQGLILFGVAAFTLPSILVAFGLSGGQRRWGLALVVLNPLPLWAATRLYPTTLCTALVLGLAWTWLRSTWQRGLMAGACMAALVHLRPSYVLLPLFGLALQFLLRTPGLLRRGALALVVFVLLVTPWAVRTSLLTGRPSVMAVSGFGNNLLYGAFEYRDLALGLRRFVGAAHQGEAEDDAALRPENDIRPRAFFEAQAQILERAPGPRNSPQWFANLDRMRLERGWAELQERPDAWAVASAIRSVKLWVGVFQQGWPSWATLAARLGSALALGLGGIGLIVLARRRQANLHLLAPVFYLGLIHPPLHTEGRYSYPVRPLTAPLILLGGGAVMRPLLSRARGDRGHGRRPNHSNKPTKPCRSSPRP